MDTNKEKISQPTSSKSFVEKIKDKVERWASDDFFVPTFVVGANASEEVLSHLSFESSQSDVFLADRDSTSLKPDLLIISGIINYKNLNNVKNEYKKLVGRKYVVVINHLAPKLKDLNPYNIVLDINEHIPVDLIIHGNPPSREEILAGLNKLKELRR